MNFCFVRFSLLYVYHKLLETSLRVRAVAVIMIAYFENNINVKKATFSFFLSFIANTCFDYLQFLFNLAFSLELLQLGLFPR